MVTTEVSSRNVLSLAFTLIENHKMLEASRQRDHCNSGPTHHPTACTWRVLNRQRLYAAPVKVNSHPTFSSPRNFTFFSMPMTFIHPNDCSTRFRFCWSVRNRYAGWSVGRSHWSGSCGSAPHAA